ncbi:hypothetical protein EV426DRAFT_635638 [Tirmania nivea]|nr:hypothetical protein EV426DRAFT_635638 [Tirmania nivea]
MLIQFLGGLILTNGVTNTNFYSMVEVFLIFNSDYGTITVNNEPWVAEFRDAVRQRDRRCLVTGRPAVDAEYYMWFGFEAAHIFPIAYEDYWNNNNYGRWISVHPSTGGSINSVQNRMLLTADLHILFDNYVFSINPDDDYKVVCFRRDSYGIAGKHIDFGNDERRPAIQLLRWQFRQAVLANMRGAGEPVFECNFPPGSDMMGDIISMPMAASRMEFELCSRLESH